MPHLNVRDVADKINSLYYAMAKDQRIPLGTAFRLRRVHLACMSNRVMLRSAFLERVTDALLELHGLVLIEFDLEYFVVAPTAFLDRLAGAPDRLVAPLNAWPTWYDGTPMGEEAKEVFVVPMPKEDSGEVRND